MLPSNKHQSYYHHHWSIPCPVMMINVFNAKKLATQHAIALTSDALTVIIMGMLQDVAPTKSHLQAHQQGTGTTTLVDMVDQHLRVIITPYITTMTIGIDISSADLDLTPITLDIGVTVTVILAEVALDPFTDPHTIAHHATGAQAHTATAKTHHTADPHHAGVSPEMTADPEHAHPTNTITKPQKDHLPVHIQCPGSPRTGSTNRLQLMTHPQSTIALMNRTVIQRMI